MGTSTAGSGDKYCLRWNDFSSNISSAFRDIRSDADFFDVTLVTEESHVQAHRLILSACSSHLRTLLKRLGGVPGVQLMPLPVIYLRGVRHCDLLAILEFMYHGEVNVAQEELNSFLAVAEDLKVKGLTQNSTSTPSSSSAKKTKSSDVGPSKEAKRQKLMRNGDVDIKEELLHRDSVETVSSVDDSTTRPQQEPTSEQQQTMVVEPEVGIEGEEDVGGGEGAEDDGYEDFSYSQANVFRGEAIPGHSHEDETTKDFRDSELVTNMIDRSSQPDGRPMCTICGLTGSNITRIKNHIESVHFRGKSAGYQCEICQASCKTKHGLACHKSRHHPRKRVKLVGPQVESPAEEEEEEEEQQQQQQSPVVELNPPKRSTKKKKAKASKKRNV